MNRSSIGGRAGTVNFHLLSKISAQHNIHLRLIPSNVVLTGNGTVDNLVKAAFIDRVYLNEFLTLTFKELFPNSKILTHKN